MAYVKGQSGNLEGGPPKELTYRELIKQAQEQQSKYDRQKKRAEMIVEKLMDQAEQGSLPHAKEVMDRVEGKAPIAVGTFGEDGKFVPQNIQFTLVPSPIDERPHP